MSPPVQVRQVQRKPKRVASRLSLRRKRIFLPLSFALFSLIVYLLSARLPVEPGLNYASPERPVHSLKFFADVSWRDNTGQRQLDQAIFDHLIELVGQARKFILIDMFLFNAFQGPEPETTRLISGELVNALVAQKQLFPNINITIITDPINTVYGGARSEQFDRLESFGVDVVLTDLAELRDSNPVYSFIWRALIKPFGNSIGDTLPNPFGAGRVTLRSYLRMINFKANHRKVVLADNGRGDYTALVTSANPHDGSSAHRNIALSFSGPVVNDLVISENAVLALSELPPLTLPVPTAETDPINGVNIQLLTEGRIKEKILQLLGGATAKSQIDLLMFYLSDRDVIRALIEASTRGATVRVILDVNQDAFGREKNGVPNKPVAGELVSQGVDVRWCDTVGEQCHAKMLLVNNAVSHVLLQGSANFTRRNLDNYNLETNVLVRGDENTQAIADAQSHFNMMWSNQPDKSFTVPYELHRDDAIHKKIMYRIMEASGLSTF